nr:beta-D-glucosyl crocetin beta-1,6-glucosyltransferase-like [Ipomoea batatas]
MSAILIDNEAGVTLAFYIPSVVRGTSNEGLDKVNSEEAEEINERGDEGDNGGEFGESNDMERGRIADLVAPADEKVVGNGEEEGEENAVSQVERERESIRGLRGR